MSPKKEYGDFQTPLSLARRVAALVKQEERHVGTIVEPTCGLAPFCGRLPSFLASHPTSGDLMSTPTTSRRQVLPLRGSDCPQPLFSSVISTLSTGRSFL